MHVFVRIITENGIAEHNANMRDGPLAKKNRENDPWYF